MSRSKQGRWIGYMFYPDCKAHMDYMRHIMDVDHFPYIFIKHRAEKKPLMLVPNGFQTFVPISTIPDPYTKEHIHFLCKHPKKITAMGAIRQSCGAVHYVEVIENMYSMCQYLLHVDFASMQAGKRIYPITDLHYSDSSLFAQLYGFKSDEEELCYIPLIARIGQECENYMQLVNGLSRLALTNPDASSALKWATNHPGTIRLMFPYFPNSISDVIKIRRLQFGQDNSY